MDLAKRAREAHFAFLVKAPTREFNFNFHSKQNDKKETSKTDQSYEKSFEELLGKN